MENSISHCYGCMFTDALPGNRLPISPCFFSTQTAYKTQFPLYCCLYSCLQSCCLATRWLNALQYNLIYCLRFSSNLDQLFRNLMNIYTSSENRSKSSSETLCYIFFKNVTLNTLQNQQYYLFLRVWNSLGSDVDCKYTCIGICITNWAKQAVIQSAANSERATLEILLLLPVRGIIRN
jgi:hypothetical protein